MGAFGDGVPDYFKEAFPENLRAKAGRLVARIAPYYFRWRQRKHAGFYSSLIGATVLVRYDVVQEAFERWRDLPVTNQAKTDTLMWKNPFLLALPELNDDYREMYKAVRQAWSEGHLADLETITTQALENQMQKLGPHATRLDVLQDFMFPAFVEIVDQFYGVRFDDPRERSDFYHAQFVISSYFFGSAEGSLKTRAATQLAFNRAWEVLLARVVEARADATRRRGVMERLLAYSPDDELVTSFQLGMILGFVPTSGNGQGRLIQKLVGKRKILTAAKATYSELEDAAASGDSERESRLKQRLLKICHEALRLNYILPGLWRKARPATAEDKSAFLTLGSKESGIVRIPLGAKRVLLAGQAAMLDPRRFPRPCSFDPDRAHSSFLNYGNQMHFCVGWDLSDIIMRESVRILLKYQVDKLGFGGKGWRGAYPWSHIVKIRVPSP